MTSMVYGYDEEIPENHIRNTLSSSEKKQLDKKLYDAVVGKRYIIYPIGEKMYPRGLKCRWYR